MFDTMMNDNVDLLKADGREFLGLRASVQGGTKVFMSAGTLHVEPGDLIRRHMSTGAEETFEVVEPGFFETFGSIPANYQMTVRRLGAAEAASAIQHITYNVNGPNARINQGSVDSSVNIATVDSSALALVDSLRSEIDRLELDADERIAALEIVAGIRSEVESGHAKKAVVAALLKALPAAAGILGIAVSIKQLLG